MLTVFTAVRFCGALFCAAGAVLLVFAGLDRLDERKVRFARICKVILLSCIAAGFLLYSLMQVWVLQWAQTDEETPVSAVVVFGAGVNGTVPSLSLRVRLEAALDYVRERPDIPSVVSGGQGPGEDITEARCMADWLIERGVDPDRILLEERATNTKENVDYSLELLADAGIDTLSGIAYVTADYHLCRAVYLTAGYLKYTFTYKQGAWPYIVPVAAKMPQQYWPITVNYYIREAFGMARLLLLP